MIVRGATREQIEAAGTQTGIRIKHTGTAGRGLRFTLGLGDPGPDGTRRYQRTSASAFQNGRKVNAVCFHGHRDFMEALFRAVPDAVLVSGKARYDGVGDFNAYADFVGDSNVGSKMYPVGYRDACECGQRD